MTDFLSRLGPALEGSYRIKRELGHGGMATVYLARDLRHERTIAIKVLRPELTEPVGAERFLREIRIASQLQHPHILPLLDSGEAAGLLYYVMPFVEGESLRDRLAGGGALPVSEATRLLRDIVDGLAHAHRHGVVHRDMKPENVMLAERHALILDFGVAKAMHAASSDERLTSIGISLGTPAYMAPEQAAGDDTVDHRADLYAVGVVAYEMLAGRPPFSGSPRALLAAHVSSPPRPLGDVAPTVPPALAATVMRCLEKDPERRYQTADDLLLELEALATPAGTAAASRTPRFRSRRAAIGGAAVLVLSVVAFLAAGKIQRDRWLHQTAIPELRRLVSAANYDSAFMLARDIEAVDPGDSTVAALRGRFSRRVLITSEPAGVRIARASLADTSQWIHVGTTPMDSVWLPLQPGLFRFEKTGFRTLYRISTPLVSTILLDSVAAPHPEMVPIPGGRFRPFLVGIDWATHVVLSAFRMDRFEITNRQYQAFIDAGGYRRRELWAHPFVDGGRVLSWEEAIGRFVDRTRRRGPSTWEGGSFPPGQAEYPVAGVSWYEASAYAKFSGKSLPTVHHWARSAGPEFARYIIPQSNIAGRSPLPIGRPRGLGAGGVSDVAGNVREWCLNETGNGQRFILGGGWSDPTYSFVDAQAAAPMDRGPINGIRLVLHEAGDTTLARAQRPISRAFTDFTKETPVSDAVFAGYLPLFEYDAAPLEANVEARDTTESWILERVSFAAPYGGERILAWIYFPRNATQPLQTIVLFPGSGVLSGGPSAGQADMFASWIVASGRVLVYPVYKGANERDDSLASDIPDRSVFWRDHVVMWVKDFRRTLDYLSTRSEFDLSRVGYLGHSWGGYMGGIIPAVEPRITASVLYVGGLTMERARPEVEPFNYLPRVRVPTLMLNGRHDFFYPVETSQIPFFRALGTRASYKKHLVYEGGHDVPRTELVAQTLAWFDRYLGPVR